MKRLEELQDMLTADGLDSAGITYADGVQAAIVELDPPVIAWLKPHGLELRADLGAIFDAEPEDGPDPPKGTWTICEDEGRCWLITDEDDEPPADFAGVSMRCRALSAIVRELLPAMAEDWDAEPPLDEALARSTGADLRIEHVGEPFDAGDTGIVRLLQELTGKQGVAMPYWTDAALLAAAGIPTVLFGPKGDGPHADVEYVELSSVARVRDTLRAVACAFCG